MKIRQASGEFALNPATIHRYLKAGRLKRWRRAGDRRTFLDRGELRRLVEFRPEPPKP